MRLFQRRDVVGAVDAHEAEIAGFLAGADDVALLLGRHAGEDDGVGREGGENPWTLREEGAWVRGRRNGHR